MTFSYFDLYLKNETLYEFRVIEFFAPYDPKKNLTCITTILVPCNFAPPPVTPMHPTDFSVHPRSVY